MANEPVMLKHVAETSALDADDPGVNATAASKIVAKALIALATKLDADATVTDTNYLATINALTL